ncbi:hypothetical protein [Paludisphaera rhizosphaerae]|uniref:hypothetical protein n=1 Tax=Paludisphaera rhizosphaerae TaxID=2711216 RepID=UPI0013EC6865|nr:hypothetical protein [Paludisphaera rhizosphaerae]
MAGELLRKYQGIQDRLDDLSPLEPRLRQIYTDGKREQLLQGKDAQGGDFVPVKPSTVKTRGGAGPPLAPHGEASWIVSGYRVWFERIPATLRIIAGWSLDWVKYHEAGTRHMPKRDPGGFREQDRRAAFDALRKWIYRGER